MNKNILAVLMAGLMIATVFSAMSGSATTITNMTESSKITSSSCEYILHVHVYRDENENGIQDPGEINCLNAEVHVHDSDNLFGYMMTKRVDGNGIATFYLPDEEKWDVLGYTGKDYTDWKNQYTGHIKNLKFEEADGKEKSIDLGLEFNELVGSIRGKVKDSAGNGIGGAEVTCKGEFNDYERTDTTLGSGYGSFSFGGLDVPGTYILTVTKEGYKTQSKKVVFLFDGDITDFQRTVDLRLGKRARSLDYHPILYQLLQRFLNL